MTVLSAMCALSLYVGRVGLLASTKALLFQRSACSRGYACRVPCRHGYLMWLLRACSSVYSVLLHSWRCEASGLCDTHACKQQWRPYACRHCNMDAPAGS